MLNPWTTSCKEGSTGAHDSGKAGGACPRVDKLIKLVERLLGNAPRLSNEAARKRLSARSWLGRCIQ